MWSAGQQEHSPPGEEAFPLVDAALLQNQVALDEDVPLVVGALLLQTALDLVRPQIGDVPVVDVRRPSPQLLLLAGGDGGASVGLLALRGRFLGGRGVVVVADDTQTKKPGELFVVEAGL